MKPNLRVVNTVRRSARDIAAERVQEYRGRQQKVTVDPEAPLTECERMMIAHAGSFSRRGDKFIGHGHRRLFGWIIYLLRKVCE
jgi:hypothetical protein